MVSEKIGGFARVTRKCGVHERTVLSRDVAGSPVSAGSRQWASISFGQCVKLPRKMQKPGRPTGVDQRQMEIAVASFDLGCSFSVRVVRAMALDDVAQCVERGNDRAFPVIVAALDRTTQRLRLNDNAGLDDVGHLRDRDGRDLEAAQREL